MESLSLTVMVKTFRAECTYAPIVEIDTTIVQTTSIYKFMRLTASMYVTSYHKSHQLQSAGFDFTAAANPTKLNSLSE